MSDVKGKQKYFEILAFFMFAALFSKITSKPFTKALLEGKL